MLGQPVYFLTPDVVGFELTGRLREGVTATDLVLDGHRDPAQREGRRQVRRVLRRRRREPVGARPRDHRPTWRPSTARRWASSRSTTKTIDYFQGTGRTPSEIEAFAGLLQGAGPVRHAARRRDRLHARSSRSTSAPSRRASPGPKRPQDRIELGHVKDAVHGAVQQAAGRERLQPAGRAPADAPSRARAKARARRRRRAAAVPRTPSVQPGAPRYVDEMDANKPTLAAAHARRASSAQPPSGDATIGNGDVLIAAITSCTNTSNPSVMLARRPAREEGGRGRPDGRSRTSRPRSRPARASSPST